MWIALDVETNGLPRYDLPADHPSQPRIASIALIYATPDLMPTHEWSALIKPDGWVMGEEAGRVNGLSTEQLEADGIPIGEALAIYGQAIDAGRVVIAFNAQHDVKALRGALRRAGLDDRFERTPNICAMRAATGVCRIPKAKGGGYKFPKLAEAYQHFYKRPIEGAHTALGDARACLEIARFLKRINCLPEPQVHHAKEGTKAGEALRARREAESTEETMPSTHMSDG